MIKITIKKTLTIYYVYLGADNKRTFSYILCFFVWLGITQFYQPSEQETYIIPQKNEQIPYLYAYINSLKIYKMNLLN